MGIDLSEDDYGSAISIHPHTTDVFTLPEVNLSFHLKSMKRPTPRSKDEQVWARYDDADPNMVLVAPEAEAVWGCSSTPVIDPKMADDGQEEDTSVMPLVQLVPGTGGVNAPYHLACDVTRPAGIGKRMRAGDCDR